MQLHNSAASGVLVEPINVLGNDRRQLARRFQAGQGLVPGVGPGTAHFPVAFLLHAPILAAGHRR